MRTLKETTQNKIASAVELGIKADKAGSVALDLLIADGFDKVTDYVSPKSDGSTVHADEWVALKAAVVLGFTKTAQALIAKPTKSLSELQKADKRYWQQQVNARIGDFKSQLNKRLDAGKSEGAGSRDRSLDQRVRDNLNDVIKVCEKAEKPTFDVTDMILNVKRALAILDTTKAEE
tara:strand:+ start:84 stop:614 length:531 start_codon:yes stop_codon:yes gene_type:complete